TAGGERRRLPAAGVRARAHDGLLRRASRAREHRVGGGRPGLRAAADRRRRGGERGAVAGPRAGGVRAGGDAGAGRGGGDGGGRRGERARRGGPRRHEPVQSQGETGGVRDVTKYETVYILEPSYDEVKAQEMADRVSGWLKDLGAEVVEVQKWGKRRLAYEIRKRRDGVYTMVVWNGGSDNVKEHERRPRPRGGGPRGAA